MSSIKASILAIIAAAFLFGGYTIKQLRDDNHTLSVQVQTLENIREDETLHFGREIQRIDDLSKIKILQEGFKNDAIEDVSDDGNRLSVSRVMRLKQIR